MTCFLIDDDADDRDIFTMALSKVNYSVDCIMASDPIEGLERLQTDPAFIPNIIFIDLNMPRMNGKQCLKEIKKLDHLQQVPVFIYSTSSEPRDILEAKQLGANDYLIKQSSIGGLVRILEQVFQKHLHAFNPA